MEHITQKIVFNTSLEEFCWILRIKNFMGFLDDLMCSSWKFKYKKVVSETMNFEFNGREGR